MTCPEVVSVAAYLLGALQPEETAEMRRHLATCEDCRDELVDIAPVIGWLRRQSLRKLCQAETNRRGFRRLLPRHNGDTSLNLSPGAPR